MPGWRQTSADAELHACVRHHQQSGDLPINPFIAMDLGYHLLDRRGNYFTQLISQLRVRQRVADCTPQIHACDKDTECMPKSLREMHVNQSALYRFFRRCSERRYSWYSWYSCSKEQTARLPPIGTRRPAWRTVRHQALISPRATPSQQQRTKNRFTAVSSAFYERAPANCPTSRARPTPASPNSPWA